MAEESQTERDMKFALAGESQARRKYKAFGEKAKEEGYTQVAKLFKAAEMGETIHSGYFLNKLGQVKKTKENLQAAVDGETYEANKVYPAMMDDAEAEGREDVKTYVGFVRDVEALHARLFKEALDNLGKNKEVDYYICGGCGAVTEGKPDKCPVCGAPGAKFVKVEI